MAVYLGDKQVGPIIAVVTDENVVNYEYVKQMDLFDSVSGVGMIKSDHYTDIELDRLEKILIDLTEGFNG